MKKIKEDYSYAAGVGEGMSKGSNKPIKTKKKYKFKADASALSGMTRSYFEEDSVKTTSVSTILNTLLEEIEKDLIIKALHQHQGIQTRAADSLGISERVLRYKIKKYGIRS